MIIATDKVLQPRREHDFYPTPIGHARAALDLLPAWLSPSLVLDPGAGGGVWGQAVRERWELATLFGVELREVTPPPQYHDWTTGNYLEQHVEAPDLVVGNPPYSDAEAFVRHSLDMLYSGGYLVFLLRLAFLEGQKRHAGLWREYPPEVVGVFGDRPSFTGNGKTDATAYMACVWCKGHRRGTRLEFMRGDV